MITIAQKNADLTQWHIGPDTIKLMKLVTVRAAQAYVYELDDQSIPLLHVAKVRKIFLKNLGLADDSMYFALPFFTKEAFTFLMSFMNPRQPNSETTDSEKLTTSST